MNNDEIIVFFLVGIKIYWFNKKNKKNKLWSFKGRYNVRSLRIIEL